MIEPFHNITVLVKPISNPERTMTTNALFRTLTLSTLMLSATAVTAAEGFFLAIGGVNEKEADGHVLEGKFGTIYTSPDGETWTKVFEGGPVKEGFNHANNNMLRCLTYGNGRFVATGNPKAVVVSEDGRKWKVVEAPSGSMSVAYGNGRFVAPNASHFMTSEDGLVWTRTKQPGDFKIWGPEGAGHVRETVFGNGVFVCIGEQRLSVTKDGETWLHNDILPSDRRPGRFELAFGNGRFVWTTESRGAMQSADGITWTPITFPGAAEREKHGTSLLFDGKTFHAAPGDRDDRTIYTSKDGITWTATVEKAGGTRFATAGNGRLLDNQGWSRSFAYSDDAGKTWTRVKADVPSRKVYFFDGERIIGPNGG